MYFYYICCHTHGRPKPAGADVGAEMHPRVYLWVGFFQPRGFAHGRVFTKPAPASAGDIPSSGSVSPSHFDRVRMQADDAGPRISASIGRQQQLTSSIKAAPFGPSQAHSVINLSLSVFFPSKILILLLLIRDFF